MSQYEIRLLGILLFNDPVVRVHILNHYVVRILAEHFATLADICNRPAMSDMIMDSWNKKMASDSRISQARSEAIRGVNVYQNSYGQNVDVSVTADHVYENRYGDVYGVSGNAPDQELLNRMDWRELKK